MKLTVNYARTPEELAAAHELARSRYESDFGVDLDAVAKTGGHSFEKDVLIICDEVGEIVATLTMMYPENGVTFPTEALFGMEINLHVPDLASRRLVEVGRVAKRADAGDGELIMNALMLATLEYLRLHRLDGWIATVKRPMLRFLRKRHLRKMTMMEHPAETQPIVNPKVHNYLRGNDVLYFMAPFAETNEAFGALYQLAEKGTVKLNFAQPMQNPFPDLLPRAPIVPA